MYIQAYMRSASAYTKKFDNYSFLKANAFSGLSCFCVWVSLSFTFNDSLFDASFFASLFRCALPATFASRPCTLVRHRHERWQVQFCLVCFNYFCPCESVSAELLRIWWCTSGIEGGWWCNFEMHWKCTLQPQTIWSIKKEMQRLHIWFVYKNLKLFRPFTKVSLLCYWRTEKTATLK